MECFSSSIYQKHIIEFDPNKVIGPGIITNEKIDQINNIFQELKDKKNKEEHFEEENDRIKFKINFYTIFLYFNHLFNKEKFVSLLNDEQMKDDIYSGLLANNILFKDIELTKEQIGNLIKSASNFNELLNAFSYNKDILIFLQQIQNNFDKIVEIYKKESSETKKKSKKNLIINIEEFIIPSQKDNLEEISRYYLNILDLQIKSINKIYIIFGKPLFDKYIEYFKQNKILYLFYLRTIYQSMKEKLSDFKMKNFDDIILKNAIELSNKKQLKSIEILDIYSQISAYDLKNAHSIDILEGLDASTFNDEFYEKWKKINWNEILGNQYKKFLEKIANIIKEIDNFKVLLKLFNMSKNDESKEFHANALSIMQKKFIDLLQNIKDEKIDKINNSAHNEDLIELIFYSDKMKVDLKQFLIVLTKKFNSRIINDIYANLFKKTISENLKKIIINFFVENASIADPLILLQLIDNCPSLSLKIVENLKKVIIKKEEFFELETKNMKLFQGLFERKILLGNEFSSTDYVNNNIVLLNSLQKDIEEGNIYYKEIIHFYSNNKQEELNKKLLLISSNNKELALKLQKIIDNYVKEIEAIKNDLTLVYNDLREFLFDSKKDDINILKDIIYKINNGYLNCYEKNYKEQCKDLMNTYKEKTQLRTLMKKSSFFTTIYAIKKVYVKNDFDCINQTELKFNELSNIFSKQALHSLNQDILNICARSVKGKKENDISKEVDLLMNIFKKD